MDLEAIRQLTQKMKRVNEEKNIAGNSTPKGEAAKLLNLAYDYEEGNGVPKDKQKAFELFQKAANLGSINGMFWTGMYYIYGEVTPKDSPRAFAWCKKAAENGQDDAMFVTGELYLRGEGVVRDVQKGVEWLKKSAKAGNMYAMYNLGEMYLNGKNVPVNHSEAVHWFEKAVERGNSWAMTGLGYCYANGLGVQTNSARAEYWFKKAIAAGDEEAKKYLEELQNRRCFITTAICKNLNKPDDCYELTTFRNFRDTWLAAQPDGKNLIAEYYAVAPKIVAAINRLAEPSRLYREIWEIFLEPCLKNIERGRFSDCKKIYVAMVKQLEKIFIG